MAAAAAGLKPGEGEGSAWLRCSPLPVFRAEQVGALPVVSRVTLMAPRSTASPWVLQSPCLLAPSEGPPPLSLQTLTEVCLKPGIISFLLIFFAAA